jgi:hypothetical protein
MVLHAALVAMPRGSLFILIALSLVICLWINTGVGLRSRASLAAASTRIFYVAPNGDDASDGTIEHPWATLHHAAEVLKPGEAVYIRAGNYPITQQIRAKHSGRPNAWIVYTAFPGERVVIDAAAIEVPPPSGSPPFPHDQGAFQLEKVRYIQVSNLEIINSRNAGFTIRQSHHVDLYNNKTENTFASGIGVWNGHHHRILGNTVINANTQELAFPGFPPKAETPHEAISIGSVKHFEVAYNLVQDGQKEGIDVKETSKLGVVHHNYVHHMQRQGLYVDGWGGLLEQVEVSDNVVHDCGGAGFVLSVEGGRGAKQIEIHHNLLYDNWGTGIFFSRWGRDGIRRQIKIHHNTVHHNGYGTPNPGERFYWLTGGLYLYSDRLQQIDIRHNIFSENTGFQIGYSDRYLRRSSNIAEVLQQKHISIEHNLISGVNTPEHPIYAGWAPDDYAHIYATPGTAVVAADPRYVAPETGNFYLQPDSPALGRSSPSYSRETPEILGAFPVETGEAGAGAPLWWQANFPPVIQSLQLEP